MRESDRESESEEREEREREHIFNIKMTKSATPKSGIARGGNKGHINTPIARAQKPSMMKGVSIN